MSSKPRRHFYLLAVLILLIGLALPLFIFHLASQPAPPSTVAVSQPTTRPTAQLIPTPFDSRVRVPRTDPSWRGDASATIEAPVKYFFGVDLANIDDRAFS